MTSSLECSLDPKRNRLTPYPHSVHDTRVLDVFVVFVDVFSDLFTRSQGFVNVPRTFDGDIGIQMGEIDS
jgi:hypothetical protein